MGRTRPEPLGLIWSSSGAIGSAGLQIWFGSRSGLSFKSDLGSSHLGMGLWGLTGLRHVDLWMG